MTSMDVNALLTSVRQSREKKGLNFRGASYSNKLNRDWGITRALYQGKAKLSDSDIPSDFRWVTPEQYNASK